MVRKDTGPEGFKYLKNKETLILKGFFIFFIWCLFSVLWGIYQNCIDIFDGPKLKRRNISIVSYYISGILHIMEQPEIQSE